MSQRFPFPPPETPPILISAIKGSKPSGDIIGGQVLSPGGRGNKKLVKVFIPVNPVVNVGGGRKASEPPNSSASSDERFV